MFLSRLSFSGSHPAVCRAGFSLPPLVPAPHQWWSVQGFPPWRLRPPYSHPAAHQIYTGRTSHPQNINPGFFSRSWRPLHTTMECPDRDREPPHKKRKSAEERRRVEEREERRWGAKDGSCRKEHPDPSTDRHPRHQHFKDSSRDRRRNGDGKDVGRENYGEKNEERTKTENKNRQRKDGTGRDEAQHRGRSEHQQGGLKDPPSAGSRTQFLKSGPEQDTNSSHEPKPNPWFKERTVEHHRSPQEEQFRNRTHRSNPCQADEATRQPSPPVRRQDGAAPVKRKKLFMV